MNLNLWGKIDFQLTLGNTTMSLGMQLWRCITRRKTKSGEN